jgi:hypothetical protein
MVTVFPEVTDKAGVPRTLQVPFPMGRPCGEPFDFETRKQVVEALLGLTALPAGTRELYKDVPFLHGQ